MWLTALKGLSDAQRQLVLDAMTPRRLAPRTPLLRQGEKAGGISVIVSGRIRSMQISWDGRASTNVYGKDTMLGLISTVLDQPAYASLESLDDALVSQLSRAHLMRLMETVPQLSQSISATLAEFCVTCAQRKFRAEEQTPLRLAQILCDLARLEDSASPSSIHGLTQQDLATMVNASRGWVVAKLSRLEQLGLLIYRRAVITIPDLQALERYAQGQFEAGSA